MLVDEDMPRDVADRAMQPEPSQPSKGQSFYARLMSLTLRHEFYGGELCPDFEIRPTGPTQTLMSLLGLIARPRRGGIDIIYQTDRFDGLVRYLYEDRRHREEDRRHRKEAAATRPADLDLESSYRGSWSRLTFTLALKNELFANFTAIPFPMPDMMKLGDYAVYLSNRFVKEPVAKPAQLHTEWGKHWRLLPVSIFSPELLHFDAPADAVEFNLYSTSGRTLLCAAVPKNRAGHKPAKSPPPAHLSPGRHVHVSMANETPGLFRYQITRKGHEKDRSVKLKDPPVEFFYFGMRNRPLLVADLFLADPETKSDEKGVGGYYPIRLPKELPKTLSAAPDVYDYEFQFNARQTLWIYYIVASSGTLPKNLAIVAESKSLLEFHEPREVTLPTRARAYQFIAKAAMPLRRRPEITLRLLSGDPRNGSPRILLERLPTPSAERITAWPSGPLTNATAASEVFVYL